MPSEIVCVMCGRELAPDEVKEGFDQDGSNTLGCADLRECYVYYQINVEGRECVPEDEIDLAMEYARWLGLA